MKVKIIAFSLVLFTIVGAYVFRHHTKEGCDFQDGHWASNGSYCITRDCYKNKSCGVWAAPSIRCSSLKIGDPISEVYFQLGNPRSINSTIYTWPVGKGEPGEIKANIVNDKLKELNCNGT